MPDLTPDGLRARAQAFRGEFQEWATALGGTPWNALEVRLLTAFTALVAEARLEAGLVAQMPGRACVRPDHNGGEGSEGRVYGVMCGGCAFELAQDEAAAARREATGLLRLIATEALGNAADEYASVPMCYVMEATRLTVTADDIRQSRTQEETP